MNNLIERLRATNKRVRHSQELRDEAAAALEESQKYAPYPGDQALAGPDMPPMKSILDLIRYCTTVHNRFGNTCVDDLSLKWGGSALNYRSALQERIEQLEAMLQRAENVLCTTPGIESKFIDEIDEMLHPQPVS